MGNLEDLVQHRPVLLLAEAVAWLHDMGKCDEEMLREAASDFVGTRLYHYKTAHLDLIDPSLSLSLPGAPIPVSVQYLLQYSRPRILRKPNEHWLIRTLGLCHAVAHTEKAETYYLVQQKVADTRLSTPFGYESAPITGLKAVLTGLKVLLDDLPFKSFSQYSDFRRGVKDAFSKAVGETRRPLNDVSLWIWSRTVAAFYKAALAFTLLGNTSDPSTIDLSALHWRFLSIRFNGLQFLGNVARISDLLARQKLIEDSFRNVRLLIEETYPLGTEVYSDENGSVFIVPDIDSLLELQDQTGTTLRQLILQAFRAGTIKANSQLEVGGEIVPQVGLSPTWPPAEVPWPSLRDPQPSLEELNPPPPWPIAEQLPEIPANRPDPDNIRRWWRNNSEDICSVCHLRPQGWGASAHPMHHAYRARGEKCPPKLGCQLCKSLERKVCSICEQRREDRSQRWADEEQNTTIWLDEVADTSGRLALVVGKFGLEPWLDGRVLFYPKGQSEEGTTPSPKQMIGTGTPARLLRVWETTRKFWQDITSDFKTSVGLLSTRLYLQGEFLPSKESQDKEDRQDALAVSHAYDLRVGISNLSITCTAKDEYIIIDNLRRSAFLLGAPKADYEDETKAANYLQNDLFGSKYEVEEPTGYGSPNKLRGRLHITNVIPKNGPYIPAISLFTEPRTFMVLVPAEKALDVVEAIKKKYEEEIGKVRNRLPLTLGIVFTESRTPLPAILDAGRRMLKPSTEDGEWIVRKVDLLSVRDSWADEVKLLLEKNGQRIPVTVRTIMEDDTVKDVWHPYWRVERDSLGQPPSGRTRQYVDAQNHWWVHIHDLQENDVVCFMPSRFDFEFLDTAARRFEVSYEDDRRRTISSSTRPYYLEQLNELEELWTILSQSLTTTQIHNLLGIIETKRAAWQVGWEDSLSQQAFETVVHDALGNVEWRPNARPSESQLRRLCQAAVSGQLADVVELYIRILKCPTQLDKQEGN